MTAEQKYVGNMVI